MSTTRKQKLISSETFDEAYIKYKARQAIKTWVKRDNYFNSIHELPIDENKKNFLLNIKERLFPLGEGGNAAYIFKINLKKYKESSGKDMKKNYLKIMEENVTELQTLNKSKTANYEMIRKMVSIFNTPERGLTTQGRELLAHMKKLQQLYETHTALNKRHSDLINIIYNLNDEIIALRKKENKENSANISAAISEKKELNNSLTQEAQEITPKVKIAEEKYEEALNKFIQEQEKFENPLKKPNKMGLFTARDYTTTLKKWSKMELSQSPKELAREDKLFLDELKDAILPNLGDSLYDVQTIKRHRESFSFASSKEQQKLFLSMMQESIKSLSEKNQENKEGFELIKKINNLYEETSEKKLTKSGEKLYEKTEEIKFHWQKARDQEKIADTLSLKIDALIEEIAALNKKIRENPNDEKSKNQLIELKKNKNKLSNEFNHTNETLNTHRGAFYLTLNNNLKELYQLAKSPVYQTDTFKLFAKGNRKPIPVFTETSENKLTNKK